MDWNQTQIEAQKIEDLFDDSNDECLPNDDFFGGRQKRKVSYVSDTVDISNKNTSKQVLDKLNKKGITTFRSDSTKPNKANTPKTNKAINKSQGTFSLI